VNTWGGRDFAPQSISGTGGWGRGWRERPEAKVEFPVQTKSALCGIPVVPDKTAKRRIQWLTFGAMPYYVMQHSVKITLLFYTLPVFCLQKSYR
jgi:hypothetical protein